MDQKHFESYAHHIEYAYNSRGYRDSEWPESLDALKESIWCLGDSFTVGIGSPIEHTWPYLLGVELGQRTINVSMDGASNNWISRKAVQVLTLIQPAVLICHWSYVDRRELGVQEALDKKWATFYDSIRDTNWPDCARTQRHNLPTHIRTEIDAHHGGWQDQVFDDERVIPHIKCTTEDDIENTLQCVASVEQCKQQCRVIHSFIPRFVPKSHRGQVESQINGVVIAELPVLDLARDGHHYGVKTSQSLVTEILSRL